MKILGISGSPRKGGNTEIMMREALAAVQEAGKETELVLLSEKKVSPCDGCLACVQSGICKIKDDMQPIYKEMEAADAIILGTPVYFMNVSAQMKAVIDRTYPYRRNRKLRGKVAGAIVVARRVGAGAVLSLLYSYFQSQRLIIASGGIGYGQEAGKVREGVGSAPDLSALDEARAIGKNVVWMLDHLKRD